MGKLSPALPIVPRLIAAELLADAAGITP